ncbi:hypothetical protein CR513_20928, partial [Mucuna pruriens]
MANLKCLSLPPRFEKLGSNKVCRLKKSLYGLKQSLRAWFEQFGTVVKGLGCIQSQVDHMFYKHSANCKIAILILGDSLELKGLKERLAEVFEMKELGPLKYFLGIEFEDQWKQPAETEDGGHRKASTTGGKANIFISHTSRHSPFTVSMDPMIYEESPGKELLYKNRCHLQVETYTDVYWVGSIINQRSTSGYCTFVGGNVVSWTSKKHSVVARSTKEAEFRAVGHGIRGIVGGNVELKYNSPPIKLYCDKSAISISHNPVLHDRISMWKLTRTSSGRR